MSKKFKMKAIETIDKWDFCNQVIVDENNKLMFSVCDLSGCPEDATISRCLFSADDYIDAVRFGMQLAKDGYDDIEVEWEDKKEE